MEWRARRHGPCLTHITELWNIHTSSCELQWVEGSGSWSRNNRQGSPELCGLPHFHYTGWYRTSTTSKLKNNLEAGRNLYFFVRFLCIFWFPYSSWFRDVIFRLCQETGADWLLSLQPYRLLVDRCSKCFMGGSRYRGRDWNIDGGMPRII